MTELDLDAIEARANAAAEGPWSRYETMQADTFVVGPEGLLIGGAISGPTYNRENCEFIAHSRTDIPALVAEVRRLSSTIASAGKALRSMPILEAASADPPWVKLKIESVAHVRGILGDHVRIGQPSNLGYYRSEESCSCGGTFWYGVHDGDPTRDEALAAHLASFDQESAS